MELIEDQEHEFDAVCICSEKKLSLLRFLEEYSGFLPPYVPKIGVITKIEMRQGIEGGAHAQTISELFGVSSLSECSAVNSDSKDLLRGLFSILEHP